MGKYCTVYSNFFINNDVTKTGSYGIRIIDKGHKVFNNYCEGLLGSAGSLTAMRCPIIIYNGTYPASDSLNPTILTGAYLPADDALVAFNTVVNCNGGPGINIGYYDGGSALNVPTNEFITLIGHDDILMPDYLETMDNLITKHPNASLYQTHFTYINSEGSTIRQCQPMDEIQSPVDFICHLLYNNIDTMGTGFMMRSTDYNKIGGIPLNYPNLLFADLYLWILLTQKSYKATAFNCCFSFRLHQSTTTRSADDKFQRSFEMFLGFLYQLKQESHLYSDGIERYGIKFIDFYAKGLSHRLLRTPKRLRKNNSTVSNFLDMCKSNATQLIPNEDYNPSKRFSVKLAIFIDNYMLTRFLFLALKLIYNKPIYD